jgi:hypothetical protein
MIHSLVKSKVSQRLGKRWTHDQLAQRVGVRRVDITRAVICTGDAECTARHTADIQDAIAGALGMTTGELFGEHAWFRIAGRKLAERAEAVAEGLDPDATGDEAAEIRCRRNAS